MNIAISIVVGIITLFIFDFIWLKTMFPILYSPNISHLLAGTPKLIPAALFYIMYSIALTVLIILPALSQNYSLSKIFMLAAVLGMICYATYDLTNHATLRDWPVIITVIDIVWGTVLTGTVALIVYSITKYFI